MTRLTHQNGFTLVEVLVAMVIIAVSFAAIISAVARSADTTATLKIRSYALWVAENRLTQYELDNTWPAIGTREGTTEMAGKEWAWKDKITTSLHKDIRQIEIEISDPEDNHVLASLIGAVRNNPVVTK